MRYADTLLTEGESVVLRTRQHWLALVYKARTALLLWLIGIILLGLVVWFNISPGIVRDILSGLAVVLIVLGLLIVIYRVWQWWAQDYMITNRRILKVTGILNKRSSDSSLEKVNDAILNQSIWGRMLNFGTLEILTAADMANDTYHMLNAPKEFKKVMLTQKHQLENEYMYGRPPSPPLRATPEPGPAMQTAPPPPVAASEPSPSFAARGGQQETADDAPVATRTAVDEDESLEVTETLARLADLRDQGAITAEEYEAKKDELLGRL